MGYWNFEDGNGTTTQDQTDNNNDGTLGAAGDPAWSSSKAGLGGALEFDGTDNWVTVANAASLNSTTAISVTAWIKPDTNADDKGLFDNSTAFTGYNLYMDSSGSVAMYIGNTSAINPVGEYNFLDGTWFFFAGTWDGSTIRIYVNGVLEGTATRTSVLASTDTIDIGTYNSRTQSIVDGKMDEIRVYNRGLSAAEVRYLYNHGGPVAHYKMDEGSGSTAYDASNIANDGTITGATYVTGQYGTALDFDGTDDVVTVSNIKYIDQDIGLETGLTYSAWINADGAGQGTGGQVFFKGTNTWLRVDTLSGGRLDLQASLDLATTDATLNVSSAVAVDTWHHVLMTYEDDADDEISIYVDGILIGASTDGSGAPASDTNSLLIAGTTTNNFDGTIDDFRVYQYSRSAAEIRVDYNAGLSTYFR